MNLHLSDKKCVACEGGTPPLTAAEIANLKSQIPNWNVAEDKKSILREFVFKNFKGALAFINQVGETAESEGHHPDLNLHDYKKVLVTLSTHAINGLSENDFILAAKVDKIESTGP
jgi:4a-hydroxytetrahydrobiopterin dehydratase